MIHCGTLSIETERLLLRRFSIDDAAAMYRNWASDSEVTEYLTWPAHTSIDVSKAVLEEWVSSFILCSEKLLSVGNRPEGARKRSNREHCSCVYE